MKTARIITAAVALAGLLLIPAARPASASTRPPENPVCVPLAHAIERWLPILDRATPNLPLNWNIGQPGLPLYPWIDAASAVEYYHNPVTLHWLNRWIAEVATAFIALGTVNNDATPRSLRQGLTHIRYLCPSLPESVVTGRLPR